MLANRANWTTRAAWAAWALVPVALVSYHFGPGQAAYVEDRAARLHREAAAAEQAALAAQERAYAAHLSAIAARRAAFVSQDPADDEAAKRATSIEEAAYVEAAGAWQQAADLLGGVQSVLGTEPDLGTGDIRLARARALVRSGDVWTGIEELEGLLAEAEETSETGSSESPATMSEQQALAAREELATAYYYGARLMRLAGMPQQEWRVESGKARQNFRYLAERAEQAERTERAERTAGTQSDATDDDVKRHERNVELVLNLEQSSLAEVQGKPLPKQSPCQGTCDMGKRESKCKGKKPAPPRGKKDARGAGGAGDIGAGW